MAFRGMHGGGASASREISLLAALFACTLFLGGCENATDPSTVALDFTLPANGSTLTGPVVLAVSGPDLVSVKFFVDGVLLLDDGTAPFEATFDPAQFPTGTHELSIQAFHALGDEQRFVQVVVAEPPPPPSTGGITDIVWFFGTHRTAAPESDLWPVTWADDDHQYTCWGDGWGFAGLGAGAKQSNGLSRVEGSGPATMIGVDISTSHEQGPTWAGDHGLGTGKPSDIISVDGDLLLALPNPGSTPEWKQKTTMAWSADKGATFTKASWDFENFPIGGTDNVGWPCFVQAGRDYGDRWDDFLYILYIKLDPNSSDLGKEIHLMRAKVSGGSDTPASILTEGGYEHFAGLDGGRPTWSAAMGDRRPVYADPQELGFPQAIYFAAHDEVILTCRHDGGVDPSAASNFLFLKARRPWGPWSVLKRYSDGGGDDGEWGGSDEGLKQAFGGNFSGKWHNGSKFVFVFTGIGALDSWNTVEGEFVAAE